MSRIRSFRPALECLDARIVPTITLTEGHLSIVGTNQSDEITVELASDTTLRVTLNDESQEFELSDVQHISIFGGNGRDTITISADVTIAAVITGGNGTDTITGGGGDDQIFGGTGRDLIDGLAGDDQIFGDNGRDTLNGGLDDDILHGGRGRDDLDGDEGDDLLDGDEGNDDAEDGTEVDLDVELAAQLVGMGEGEAEFEWEHEDDGSEFEFDVEVEDLEVADGSTASVFVDGVLVGTMTINDGEGELEFSSDPDDGDELPFPDDFPEIEEGSTITIEVNGSVVLSGTFQEDDD